MSNKIIDYQFLTSISYPYDLLKQITLLHELKAKCDIIIQKEHVKLYKANEYTLKQNTIASNKIEGLAITEKRLLEIITTKDEPKTKDEKEILLYYSILKNLSSVDYIDEDIFLDLHRFKVDENEYKKIDNVIIEQKDDKKYLVFQPVEAIQTEKYMIDLFHQFEYIIQKDIDPLLLIPCIILDFLYIHPFEDGNGRTSRLLTQLLLKYLGYSIVDYIPIDTIIYETKEMYYNSLQQSSDGFNLNQNNYIPFIQYFLMIMIKAYREFDHHYSYLLEEKNKPEKTVIHVLSNNLMPLTKNEILLYCPTLSKRTLERALATLQLDNKISKIQKSKKAKYYLSY